jgi:EF hand
MTRMASFLTGTTLFAVSVFVHLGAWTERAEAAARLPVGVPAAAALLLRYDANQDGTITKAELDAGLKADYAAADSNHDGCLDAAEVRVENENRLEQDGAQASPLKDWNLNGCVDMREFSNTAHSYFDLADRSKDGRVSIVELRGPSMPIAPPTTGRQQPVPRPPTPSPTATGY